MKKILCWVKIALPHMETPMMLLHHCNNPPNMADICLDLQNLFLQKMTLLDTVDMKNSSWLQLLLSTIQLHMLDKLMSAMGGGGAEGTALKGKPSLEDYGRGLASEGYSYLDKSVNIFDRVHQAYQGKSKTGHVGL